VKPIKVNGMETTKNSDLKARLVILGQHPGQHIELPTGPFPELL
jgi:hypothetical protein